MHGQAQGSNFTRLPVAFKTTPVGRGWQREGRAAPVPVPYKSTTRGKPDRDDRPAENPPHSNHIATKIQVPNYLSSAVSKNASEGKRRKHTDFPFPYRTIVRPFICTLHPMVLVLSCQAPAELKLPFPPPPSGV